MVALRKEEKMVTEISSSWSKTETKQRQADQRGFGSWTKRLILSGIVLLSWCGINALTLLEARNCDRHKQQISLKEMRIRQLQAAIASRLSELSEIRFQPPVRPIFLSINPQKPKPTLLGRR